MSKIFNALQGRESELSELLPSLIDGQPAAHIPAPFPPLPCPVPEPAAPAPAVSVAARPAAWNPCRRVSLVLPASAPVLPFEEQAEVAAEQYRIARTKIVHHAKKPRIILVASPGTGDGKTVTAINIAGALSLQAAAKVLLVDLDFRRSTLHTLLGLPRSPGAAEVLAGECEFEDAVVETEEYPNLNVLASGEPKVNPSELLESPRWHALSKALRAQYEYVVMDAPPIGAVADYELIQLSADGILLVLRPDHSKRSACFKVLESIPKEKLIGVLLNCNNPWPFQPHGGGYGYEHSYRSAQAGADPAPGSPTRVAR